MAKLYVIATPIGNLEDITFRALRILREVDLVICEDTRVTKKLLSRYDISKSLVSYHEHSTPKIHEKIREMLAEGKSAALVTDAGTPGISDPGARLVAYLRANLEGIEITPIPGPSALLAAASVAGINMDQFIFLGFPPHKKGRKTFFAGLAKSKVPIIFYESTHRVARAFTELAAVLGDTAEIMVAREITKIYEEIWRGAVKDAAAHFIGERQRGEFVIIIPKIKESAHGGRL
ncbi:MAG: 16S rRNA (cytidine(1402)-2'-O)-methyltransferase [Candidatus Niyogibacteria bacterium]|nr:16S rRNA (cytidine(1402)-2'-O)-methyltransferase [Candidatus Niyogibacteria bacterium]